ncbi:MAG: saccharopine dehydrogenase NADP-binding domain-containing protein [Agarilytica sp.]
MNTATKYDLVIYGASSFIGQILVKALGDAVKNKPEVRWAIAGRDHQKLSTIQQSLSDSHNIHVDIVIADATDDEALKGLCVSTRVVISTVGPFALYGEGLVRACCETGTDYCDITGEAHWILQMISKYQGAAAESGARFIHSCAFDSIPSDLGVLFTQQNASELLGQPCQEIQMRVMKMKGRFSGGTYASALNVAKDLSGNPGLRRALNSPYCLCPSEHPFTQRQTKHHHAEYETQSGAWIAPFVMEGINTRIVHRSNALLDNRYGEDFRYDEAIVTGTGRKGRKRASRTSYGLWLFGFFAAIPMFSAAMARWLLPKPGEGPSKEEQEQGYYELLFRGKAPGKGTIQCRLRGKKDPGYGASAMIVAQVGLCLAFDIEKSQPSGGFWTPASILGDTLIARLNDHASLTFEIDTVNKR